MIKTLRRFSLIINLKALLVTLAAVLSTYLCKRYGLAANLPLTLVATAVIFPIVFSISGAYKRRENALHQYGALKAHAKAIFFAVRDWLEDPAMSWSSGPRSCSAIFSGPAVIYSRDRRKSSRRTKRLSMYSSHGFHGLSVMTYGTTDCPPVKSLGAINFSAK
jgi:hypothetical protein